MGSLGLLFKFEKNFKIYDLSDWRDSKEWENDGCEKACDGFKNLLDLGRFVGGVGDSFYAVEGAIKKISEKHFKGEDKE